MEDRKKIGRKTSVFLESIKENSSNSFSSSAVSSDSSEESFLNKKESSNLNLQEMRDAIVSITSISLSEDSDTPLIIKGNGFFITRHYIVCPAISVLLKPDNDQYQFFNTILVMVSNVNNCGEAYSYEADVVGVDGAANIAILNINMDKKWNRSNPPIKQNHPILKWGKSRNIRSGEHILLIGNTTGNQDVAQTGQVIVGGAENGIIFGNIADNRYVSHNGMIPGELLLLSNVLCSGFFQGFPVLTLNGLIIGMYIHSSQGKQHLALSEFFMRRPIKTLLSGLIQSDISLHYRDFLGLTNNIYTYSKGWLGLAGILVSQDDYFFTVNINGTRCVTEQTTLQPKKIIGYRILALATPDTAKIYTLGKLSPLYNIIDVGDIVTHIEGCPLGDRKGQISPALVMWRIKPKANVTITYTKQKENFNIIHNTTVPTDIYIPTTDFPWYALTTPMGLLPTLI